MSVLYYWRGDNYERDRKFGFGFHLNQNSPALARLPPGETVWAFTRDRLGRYVLAASLVVRAVTHNPPGYRYGAFRVWGDLERSRYFDIDAAPTAESLIRSLGLSTRAAVLGQAFQGHSAVRTLSEAAHAVLCRYAESLPVLRTAGIYPEDELEARLLLGEDARELLLREAEGEYAVRVRYLYESLDIRRARRHVLWLQHRYGGQCQICRFDPRGEYGRQLCHAHHIQWLSRGGEDRLRNLVLVCPNHHAAIHKDDAPFDYRELAFHFTNGLVEPLQLNHHLARAA